MNINTFNSCSCSKYTNFYEYIKDKDNIDTYTFLEIQCNIGMPILFTNRLTSYFADHSYEVILPRNINFNIIEKTNMRLCGYSHDFEYISTLPKKIKKYIEKVYYIINTFCSENTNLCNLNTEIMHYMLNNKPELNIDSLIQIEKVIRLPYTDINNNANCVRIIYDRYQ